ncbi:hypothetical protein EW145_g6106 [Phellinidium pouzarii]|uniref:SHSP domain-containing protein n=1 Tax=Phellinidium pouzarii TaxID=167371 RepID=A0A4S4KXR1_9AGAM|nr:hypothetical protein EW145_g6106 [Phellinidium pouzarii]
MSLQPYDTEPFFSFSDVDEFFNNAFGRKKDELSNVMHKRRADGRSNMPKIEVYENPEANLVTMTFKLRGLKEKYIRINIQNNRLVVSGVTKVSKHSEGNGYVIKKSHSGGFTHAVPLPSGTKPKHIKASMENGILTVTFPKMTDPTKRITIS